MSKNRAAADVPTLSATSRGKKGLKLSENKNRAAKSQKHPRHALIVAGRVKNKCLRKESETLFIGQRFSKKIYSHVKNKCLRKESETRGGS